MSIVLEMWNLVMVEIWKLLIQKKKEEKKGDKEVMVSPLKIDNQEYNSFT